MKPKILIVDDEVDIRTLYKTTLEKIGFEVIMAEGGKDVFALAQKNLPDLILLDETMPDVGGVAAQQQLKVAPETAHIPVVFLTAFSNPASLSRDNEAFAKQTGAAGFIKKGIGLDEFVTQVKKYLDARA